MSAAPRPTAKQYWDLTKPRVVALIVFTAIVGMFMAVPGWPPLRESMLGFLGIWLAAASAAAINQLLDSRIDAKMARTSWRPIVVGQITPARALAFALVLAALSMAVLVLFVNTLTAVLTFLSRAQGASSIIKSGPIDLARDPIAAILAENPDDLAHLRPWHDPLVAKTYLPAMTFQVGMPLTGSDVVEAGTPGEHTGLEERKRDKRPPREDFAWHYMPVL